MNTKFIHLLYVPTMACNMQCRYCYLEDNTVDTLKGEDCVETLRYAIAKFREADVVPFNISLHGGEVTTLSKQKFHDLIQYISEYYQENMFMKVVDGDELIDKAYAICDAEV